MKNLLLAGVITLAASGAALAQTTPAPAPDATTPGETPAIATPGETNPDAPVPGENSFTEAQAKERIEAAGFTDVGSLVLNSEGVWEAAATRDGQPVTVLLDYQGNIVTR